MTQEKQLKVLRTKKKVKLSLLERAMISIALAELIANYRCDDKDGIDLLKAYKRLHTQISKECK